MVYSAGNPTSRTSIFTKSASGNYKTFQNANALSKNWNACSFIHLWSVREKEKAEKPVAWPVSLVVENSPNKPTRPVFVSAHTYMPAIVNTAKMFYSVCQWIVQH